MKNNLWVIVAQGNHLEAMPCALINVRAYQNYQLVESEECMSDVCVCVHTHTYIAT